MATEEERKKIEEEISRAQDKLSDTTMAINRERLILEDLEKQRQEAEEKNATILSKVVDTEIRIESTQEKLDNLKKKEKLASASFLEEKKATLVEFDRLKEFVSEAKTKAEESKKMIQEGLERFISESEETKKSTEKKIQALDKEWNDAHIQYDTLRAKSAEEESQLSDLKIKTENLKMSVTSLSGDKSRLEREIAGLKTESDQLTTDILEKEATLNNIKDSLTTARELFEVQKGENESLLVTINNSKTEISDFIKAKMEFQQEKSDLLNKEAFIKEKYTEAGIAYK